MSPGASRTIEGEPPHGALDDMVLKPQPDFVSARNGRTNEMCPARLQRLDRADRYPAFCAPGFDLRFRQRQIDRAAHCGFPAA